MGRRLQHQATRQSKRLLTRTHNTDSAALTQVSNQRGIP